MIWQEKTWEEALYSSLVKRSNVSRMDQGFLKKMRRFGYQSLASVIASYWIYFNKSMYYWVTMQRNLFFGWSSDERYEFIFIHERRKLKHVLKLLDHIYIFCILKILNKLKERKFY